MANPDGVEVHGPAREKYGGVLSDEALGLVAELQRELGPTRRELLARRGDQVTCLACSPDGRMLAEPGRLAGQDVRAGEENDDQCSQQPRHGVTSG